MGERKIMADVNYEFERLSTREGFNKSLSHFKTVSSLLDEFENYYNLADIINNRLAENRLNPNQTGSILFALLVDKYGYFYESYNLKTNFSDFEKIYTDVVKWNGIDIVLAYAHPELGLTALNPKNKSHWDALNLLKRDELLVIYAGAFNEKVDPNITTEAIKRIISILEGKKVKTPVVLFKGKFKFKEIKKPEPALPKAVKTRKAPLRKTVVQTGEAIAVVEVPSPGKVSAAEIEAPKKEAPKPAQPSGKKIMTPMYSVPVTNELFHNGNVEAWKKIIASYEAKNPGCEVYVFYDGERIHDINTLFKWGKVKHGSSILFAVAGDNIKDVAKLQRYLKQGASSRFEDFLRFPVNTILNLF
ncbi:MAG: hypothetical protein AB1798_12365 [Spirochaetota bacterium]